MEQSIEDIRKELIQRTSSKGKKYKYSNSGVMQKAYRWAKKHNVGLPRELFYKIIFAVNKCLRESLLKGDVVHFPYGMGTLELIQQTLLPDTNEGPLGSNLPINWYATRELWVRDKEAREKKTLVRHTNKEMYRIFYNRDKCKYVNHTFFKFLPCRDLKRAVASKAKNNELHGVALNIEVYGKLLG